MIINLTMKVIKTEHEKIIIETTSLSSHDFFAKFRTVLNDTDSKLSVGNIKWRFFVLNNTINLQNESRHSFELTIQTSQEKIAIAPGETITLTKSNKEDTQLYIKDIENKETYALEIKLNQENFPLPIRSCSMNFKTYGFDYTKAEKIFTLLEMVKEEKKEIFQSGIRLFHHAPKKFDNILHSMLRPVEKKHGRTFYTSTELDAWASQGDEIAEISTKNTKILDLRNSSDNFRKQVHAIINNGYDLQDIAHFLDVDAIILDDIEAYIYNFTETSLHWLNQNEIALIREELKEINLNKKIGDLGVSINSLNKILRSFFELSDGLLNYTIDLANKNNGIQEMYDIFQNWLIFDYKKRFVDLFTDALTYYASIIPETKKLKLIEIFVSLEELINNDTIFNQDNFIQALEKNNQTLDDFLNNLASAIKELINMQT